MSEVIEEIDDFEFSIDGIEESTDTFDVDFEGADVEVKDTTIEPTVNTVEDKKTKVPTPNAEDVFDVDELGNSLVEGNKEGSTKGSDDTPSTDDKGFSSSDGVYSRFASALYQDGILEGLTEEDIKNVKNGNEFAALISKTIKNNEYSDLNDQGRQFLEAVRAGVPIETMAKIHNTEMQLNNLSDESFIESDDDDDDSTESKRNIREQLITNDLRSRGIKESTVSRMVAASFKEGADEEDARNAIENLRETIKTSKASKVESANAERTQMQESRNALVDRIIKGEEIIPGIKVPESMRSEIAKAMTEPTGRDANGRLTNFVGDKRSENSELFDTRLNYYIKLGLFNEKPDLSIFGKQKASSALQQLEKEIGNDMIYEGGRGASLKGVAEREKEAKMLSYLDNMEF